MPPRRRPDRIEDQQGLNHEQLRKHATHSRCSGEDLRVGPRHASALLVQQDGCSHQDGSCPKHLRYAANQRGNEQLIWLKAKQVALDYSRREEPHPGDDLEDGVVLAALKGVEQQVAEFCCPGTVGHQPQSVGDWQAGYHDVHGRESERAQVVAVPHRYYTIVPK